MARGFGEGQFGQADFGGTAIVSSPDVPPPPPTPSNVRTVESVLDWALAQWQRQPIGEIQNLDD